MYLFTKYLISITLFSLLFSCSTKNEALELALQQAGTNRPELEKVLAHYQNDSLKYQATVFLIKNMPYYEYQVSPEIDSIKTLLTHIFKKGDLTEAERQKGVSWQEETSNVTYKQDIKEVKASMLIENIDYAFKVWKEKPWNKNLSFEDFCELILPYRIAEEPLTNWRKQYYQKYNHILDSLYQGTDVIEACNILCRYLREEKYFYYFDDLKTPRQDAIFQLNNRIGTCRESCDVATYVMRAVGIPVTTDIYLYSPEFQHNHQWNVVRDTTGKYLSFWYENFDATRDSSFTDERKKAKVFRMTYGIQRPIEELSQLPPSLQNPFLKDVSQEYFGKNRAIISLQSEAKNAFIGVFTARMGWLVVGQGKVTNNTATFENIEPFVIYQPLSYENGELTPIAYPFMLQKDKVHSLIPQEKQEIVLTRKYPLRKGHSANYKQWLLLSRLKASNNVSFSPVETLHIMKSLPAQNVIEVPIHSQKAYRYFQYEVPKDSVLSIAEIHFFGKDNKEVIFDTIYSNGKPWKNIALFQLKNCYDNDPISFFCAKEKGTSLFFKSSTPQSITKVILIPRNDDNFIREGDVYELFYNKGIKGWVSLGEQKGTKTEKLYYRAPKNTVLWLKNKTRGKEEQIFLYQNNRQIFPIFEEEKNVSQNLN